MEIYGKLDKLGDYISRAKSLPVIDKKIIDSEYLLESLEEIYSMLPAEVKQAKEIISKHKNEAEKSQKELEELKERTRCDCLLMIEQAEEKAKALVDETEIYARAEKEARELIQSVQEKARQIEKESVKDAEAIHKRAMERGQELEEQGRNLARKLKEEANQYAQQVIDHIDRNLLQQIESINNSGRKYFAELQEKDFESNLK